jgi:hypothetical protein
MRLKYSVIAAFVATAALLLPRGALVRLAAQSLADVARQEQERRKTIKESAKVLTNKDLAAVPAVPPAAATTPPPAADGAPSAEAGKNDAKADPITTGGKTATEPTKDQAYWSSRAKALQAELTRNETFAVALQSRINALANEYTNQSDPIQQARVATERQKATDELSRLTKQIADDKKAIATLQEDARRAGAPPGWLR